MNQEYLQKLNKDQREAVEYTDGPSIILAGAGSGKTRVLTNKVLHLIHAKKVDANRIAMMTFTNKAASEMKERVGQKLGFIGTFHSLCAMILRKDGHHIGLERNFIIYDSDDTDGIIKSLLKVALTFKTITPSSVQHTISSAKDNLLDPDEYAKLAQNERDFVIAKIYKKYQQKLQKNNAVDFDDLIFKTVMLFREHKEVREKYNHYFQYILVDEFQDTNTAQYVLAKYLAQDTHNITVVGDFSQSIYSWRGADIQNLERIKDDFNDVHVFHLEQNYRSTQNVLDLAYEVISQNEGHPILKLFTDNASGHDVVIKELLNEEGEALYIANEIENIGDADQYDNIAILYRTNAQSRVMEEALLHYGIPYILVGGTRFYERKEVKDILAYVRLYVNPEEEVSLERALKIGKKRYSDFKQMFTELKQNDQKITTDNLIEAIFNATKYLDLYDDQDPDEAGRIENLKELRSVALRFEDVNDFLEQIALVESEYSQNEKDKKDRHGVKMMTLHQAKGLEFDYVFIIGVEEGLLPHSRSLYDIVQLEEERRLLYVGITRARKKLYLTYVKKRFLFGKRVFAQVSRFIESRVESDFKFAKTF
jgi:DNA helicase-2/ATP-dependent DNA helicase PcrA